MYMVNITLPEAYRNMQFSIRNIFVGSYPRFFAGIVSG